MRTLTIDTREFMLPGSMNEMSYEELVWLYDLMKVSRPIQEVKIKMLLKCMKAKAKPMKGIGNYRIKVKGGEEFALTSEELVLASSAFDYLFTDPDERGYCHLDNRLTKAPVERVMLAGRWYYTCGDAMTDVLYDQYIHLQTYDSYQDGKKINTEAQQHWLACMLRRNVRIFEADDLDVKVMRHVKPELAGLLYWYYTGSARYIADRFPRLFGADGGSDAAGNVYDGQQRLLDFMAKADPEKKAAYKRDKLYNVLYSLDYMLEQAEKDG